MKKIIISLLGFIMFSTLVSQSTEQFLQDELARYDSLIIDYHKIVEFNDHKVNFDIGWNDDFYIDFIQNDLIITFSKNGSSDSEVILWKVDGKQLSKVQTIQTKSYCFAASKNFEYIALNEMVHSRLNDYKVFICIYQRMNNEYKLVQKILTQNTSFAGLGKMIFNKEGNTLITYGYRKFDIYSRQNNNFHHSQSFSYDAKGKLFGLTFSNNSDYLIISFAGSIMTYKYDDKKFNFYSKRDDINNVYDLDISGDGKYITGWMGGNIHIWELISGYLVLNHRIPTTKEDINYFITDDCKSVFIPISISNWMTGHSSQYIEFYTLKRNNFSKQINFIDNLYGRVTIHNSLCAIATNNSLKLFFTGKLVKFFKENENNQTEELSSLSSFFVSKDEFETDQEYNDRIKRGEEEKKSIISKYKLLFREKEAKWFVEEQQIKLKKESFIKSKIRKSRQEIITYIDNIGEYNAENETFQITINNILENIKIPRSKARSFKTNLDSVEVIGIRQLKEDLETFEDINLYIVHPISGDRYAFGKHKSLYKIPDRYLVAITKNIGNIRENPSTNSKIIKKASEGDTFSVISFNYPWFKIKINNVMDGFVHQSICSESNVQSSDIAIKPPSLKLIAELHEPSGNEFLDGEEKGSIVVKISNSGTGPAFGVIVDINNSTENPNLTYSRTRVPGEIASGETKEISFDIEANENIVRSTQSFTISALESNGFSPEPVLLIFETHPILLPEISMIDYGVNTASGDSEIIPGETANIKLRFQNIEQGNAENLNFKMNLPNNVYFNPESKKAYSFTSLNSGEYKDIEFSILTSNEVNEQIELVISMNEKHISKKYSLILEINKPLKSLQEFVQKGIETNSNPIVIASDLTADIAINIPKCKQVNSDAIAVVIGNRNYLKAKNVAYAINDAILMKEYLIKSFGYKEGNIFFLKNASKGDLELYFGTKDNYKGKLYNTVKENKSDIYIYYSGHGAPSLKDKKGYFVPVECDPNYVELSGYSLQTFYDNLAKIPAKSQIIVLDACFSGADIFENISPIITKTDNPIISLYNGIVFSSSKDSEVSSWYNEKKHGMFTYFFLKSIHDKNADLDNNNKLTANEIIKFISNNSEGVPYYSRRIHGVEQNPQLFGKNKERIIVSYE